MSANLMTRFQISGPTKCSDRVPLPCRCITCRCNVCMQTHDHHFLPHMFLPKLEIRVGKEGKCRFGVITVDQVCDTCLGSLGLNSHEGSCSRGSRLPFVCFLKVSTYSSRTSTFYLWFIFVRTDTNF